MALRTRIRLLSITRYTVLALTGLVVFVSASLASAGDSAPTPAGMMWQVIMVLFGALDTILTAIIVWLVSNQRETFQRIGVLEKGEAVRAEICKERHPHGS